MNTVCRVFYLSPLAACFSVLFWRTHSKRSTLLFATCRVKVNTSGKHSRILNPISAVGPNTKLRLDSLVAEAGRRLRFEMTYGRFCPIEVGKRRCFSFLCFPFIQVSMDQTFGPPSHLVRHYLPKFCPGQKQAAPVGRFGARQLGWVSCLALSVHVSHVSHAAIRWIIHDYSFGLFGERKPTCRVVRHSTPIRM